MMTKIKDQPVNLADAKRGDTVIRRYAGRGPVTYRYAIVSNRTAKTIVVGGDSYRLSGKPYRSECRNYLLCDPTPELIRRVEEHQDRVRATMAEQEIKQRNEAAERYARAAVAAMWLANSTQVMILETLTHQVLDDVYFELKGKKMVREYRGDQPQ